MKRVFVVMLYELYAISLDLVGKLCHGTIVTLEAIQTGAFVGRLYNEEKNEK